MDDFVSAAQPEKFWAETQADWQQAESDLREVVHHADPGQFLADLCGPLTRRLVVAPNLLFPGQRPVTVSSTEEVITCLARALHSRTGMKNLVLALKPA